MQYRFLFALLALAALTISARADTVFVKGRDKVIGTVKSEDAKGLQVTVKKAEEFIPAAEIIDVHYDDLKPAALRLSGGAYLLAKKAEAELVEAL